MIPSRRKRRALYFEYARKQEVPPWDLCNFCLQPPAPIQPPNPKRLNLVGLALAGYGQESRT
jgi:hypothetical protein